MAEKFVLSRAKAGDWVKFADDKDCVCPMRFKFNGFDGNVAIHMPIGAMDRLVKAADLVCMTAEEVARHG